MNKLGELAFLVMLVGCVAVFTYVAMPFISLIIGALGPAFPMFAWILATCTTIFICVLEVLIIAWVLGELDDRLNLKAVNKKLREIEIQRRMRQMPPVHRHPITPTSNQQYPSRQP